MTYEAEPANDGYTPTLQEVGAAVVLLLGAIGYVLTWRGLRHWRRS